MPLDRHDHGRRRPGGGRRPRRPGARDVTVAIIPVTGLPEIAPGDDLASLLAGVADIRDGDVVAVTQKVVSKHEGRLVPAGERVVAIGAAAVEAVGARGDLAV